MKLAAPLGHIVFVWFPEDEQIMIPGPKFRPCLVIATDTVDGGPDRVLVVPGTSQNTMKTYRGEFVVPARMQSILRKDTKFNLRVQVWLPVTEEYFADDSSQQLTEVMSPALFIDMREAYGELR